MLATDYNLVSIGGALICRSYRLKVCLLVYKYAKLMSVIITLALSSFILGVSSAQSSDTSYKTFNGLPCSFNGVTIGDHNDTAELGKTRRGCVWRTPYKGKRGQSFHVKRGTPIVAPTNLRLKKIENWTAEENCRFEDESAKRYILKHGCQKPYDALWMELVDERGNLFLFYHLMENNPFVPGFGKGECAHPQRYKEGSISVRYPRFCGGVVKREVAKGEVIGYSGTTGKSAHFSFAVEVNDHDSFPGESGWIIPSNELVWENLPSDNPHIFLFPVLSD